MTIQENIPLKEYTTFHLGGAARYFCGSSSPHELIEALHWAQDRELRYFILGGGSNLLFPDSGFDGLVIKPEFHELRIEKNLVHVGASVRLAALIEKTLNAGLTGLEFAAGIPGGVGGAIRGNAGTYGVAMSDVVTEISVVTESDFRSRVFTTVECEFKYRHSMFKQHNHIITGALLTLASGDTAASKRLIDERIVMRRTSHPLEPSAGCIFKNIEFARAPLDNLRKKGLDLSKFERYQKIPTGYLIEQLGLKGKTIGGAQISQQHANYIINTGTATFEDVMVLISYIKQQVRDTYGIQLEEEVHAVL